MAEQTNITRAELRELKPDGTAGDHRVSVQFNPETLRVSFSNQIVPPQNPAAAQDQSQAASTQFVGRGSTKLSVQLWFDVTALPSDRSAGDVRELTKEVIYFITPHQDDRDPAIYRPPGISFIWGSFQFDGIVEGMDESLEFFSSDGRPLRASITMNLSQQGIEVRRNDDFTAQPGGGAGRAGAGAPGTRPLAQASAGSTVQGMAASRGLGSNWQEIAAANQIENPRLLEPGRFIDMNAVTARLRGRS
jgi:hypothetical protein